MLYREKTLKQSPVAAVIVDPSRRFAQSISPSPQDASTSTVMIATPFTHMQKVWELSTGGLKQTVKQRDDIKTSQTVTKGPKWCFPSQPVVKVLGLTKNVSLILKLKASWKTPCVPPVSLRVWMELGALD